MKTNHFSEILRFGIVGVVATLLQFVVYYLLVCHTSYLSPLTSHLPFLTSYLSPHNIALAVSYIISLTANFFLTTYFTFRVKPSTRKGIGFLASHAINFTLQFLLLNLFIWLGVDKQWALIPVFLVCIPLNFILVRLSVKKL